MAIFSPNLAGEREQESATERKQERNQEPESKSESARARQQEPDSQSQIARDREQGRGKWI